MNGLLVASNIHYCPHNHGHSGRMLLNDCEQQLKVYGYENKGCRTGVKCYWV
jgi:hypothetical protein